MAWLSPVKQWQSIALYCNGMISEGIAKWWEAVYGAVKAKQGMVPPWQRIEALRRCEELKGKAKKSNGVAP